MKSNQKLQQEILSLLKRTKRLTVRQIASILSFPKNKSVMLKDSLRALQRNALIKKEGKFYLLKDRLQVQEGYVDLDERGRLVIRSKDTDEIITRDFDKEQTKVGDIVRLSADSGRKSIRVKEVINREMKFVVGRFYNDKYLSFVSPDSKIIKKDIYIAHENIAQAKAGDKVVCEILNPEDITTGADNLEGKIVEVLGKSGEMSAEIKSVLVKYGFNTLFPRTVLNEANNIYKKASIQNNRLDLRNLVCFTIDPEDAKDFDDAISVIEDSYNHYVIGVHIADVSHYVKEGSSIDREALRRGTSVYLLDTVNPMLPEVLSNGICSLKENEDRLCISVIIKVNEKFEIKEYEITKSIINSKKRFTYEEVEEIIKKKKGKFAKDILLLNKIAREMTKRRIEEGSLDFYSPEVKFFFDKDGKIADIKIKERLQSMRLVEELMLLANKCVTEFVVKLSEKYRKQLPFIYRVHDDPDQEKLERVSEFIRQFGFKADLKNKDAVQLLLKNVENHPAGVIINDLLIRAMAKAKYTPVNIGHYGLGFKNYTHFTSPIRRYPDLVVHRLIELYLKFSQTPKDKKVLEKISSYRKVLKDICKHSSFMEQQAVSAERETTKLKQIEFMSSKVGNSFEGIISGMVEYGMFVELIDYLVEGMIRFRDVTDDYYIYDSANYCAVGTKTGRIFRAGDKVRVILVSADIETRKLDFVLADEKKRKSKLRK
ncbi:MAG: ribonuclease R [Ignavibacteria bacterium]